MKAIGDTLPRRFKAKASGSITAGKPLIVEADGDVAQVTEGAASVGTPVVLARNPAPGMLSAYLAKTAKAVLI